LIGCEKHNEIKDAGNFTRKQRPAEIDDWLSSSTVVGVEKRSVRRWSEPWRREASMCLAVGGGGSHRERSTASCSSNIRFFEF